MQLLEECSLTAHRLKLFRHNVSNIQLAYFQKFFSVYSATKTWSLKSPKSPLSKGGDRELILCTCACMHLQENLSPTATEDAASRICHSIAAIKLWQSIKNTNPQNTRPHETSHSVRSQINHLIRTTATFFSSVFQHLAYSFNRLF